MKTRTGKASIRLLCRVGLSCLLAVSAEIPLLGSLRAFAEGMSDLGVPFYPEEITLVDPEPELEAKQGCASLQNEVIVPELLALAPWPLDDPGATQDCGKAPKLAVALEPLPPPMEISTYPPVVQVIAGDMDGHPAATLAHAAPRTLPDAQEIQLAALDTATLDEIRGGFEAPELNLKFSFGIERAVYINGELVASTVLNPRDLQGAVGGAAQAVVPGTAFAVVQNGNGNTFSAQVNPNMAGTVIQNTLNDQKIVNLTTINATINSAQMLRAMNLQSAIRDGVVNSLRR